MARLVRKVVAGSGTFKVPHGVDRLWVYGAGGGGGGGSGCSGSSGSTVAEPSGGGGGGGGTAYGQWLDVTPGETLNFQCGAGGAGGVRSGVLAGNPGTPGGPGGTTTLSNASFSVNLIWPGGVGGAAGGQGNLSTLGVPGGRNALLNDVGWDSSGYITLAPGYGGWANFSSATTYGYARWGQYSGMCSARVWSANAGVPGVNPANSGSYKSGGAGGGGGFTDWPMESDFPGVPGFGGNGGTANSGGAAISAGTAGASATGTGHGGGGGGAGACSSGTASLGANGGDGAPGAIIFAWVE